MERDIYDIASELIQFTSCSIFLTGKAGTGKTTFLKRLRESSSKQIAVVAPTGVAAVNAGGSTIHSFFQIAPGTLIPTPETNYQFLAKQRVTSQRRRVYAALELLVIDEISMVRADLIDTIDLVLRHYRYRPNEPFGGVQVMLIGDMHQLPPVCNGEDWQLLQRFYRSPYFFHSKVVQELQPLYVEFDKIFRQKDIAFVELLNNLRDNRLTQRDYELLATRYIPNFEARDDQHYIMLTTHNVKADSVNSSKLSALDNPSHYYSATISGDFSDKNYPTDEQLHLKEGAKVMFCANDKQPTKRYFNGKIGIVTHISEQRGIIVRCADDNQEIVVDKETWNNVKYTYDQQTNTINESITGTFTQYPLRLAWAITIHKSQGLTFDRAIIDAGAAFSAGQVYVAMSRCRSLEGIVLTTQITSHSLAVDSQVVEFAQGKLGNGALQTIMEESKRRYGWEILYQLFGLADIYALSIDTLSYFIGQSAIVDQNGEGYLLSLRDSIDEHCRVGQRFVQQLQLLYDSGSDRIAERISAASAYFAEKLSEVLGVMETSPITLDSKALASEYEDKFGDLYSAISQRLWLLKGVAKDYSVENYFRVKASYRSQGVKITAYSGATERSAIKCNHPELYKLLSIERNSICGEIDVPVYFVATTKMLVAVANYLPISSDDLLAIKGFGKEKTREFGGRFLGVVDQYCRENGIGNSQRCNREGMAVDSVKVAKSKKVKVRTQDVTFDLIGELGDISLVARERNLTVSTIWSHVAKLVEEGRLKATDYIPAEMIADISEYVESHNAIGVTTIYKHFNEEYPYDSIRVALADLAFQASDQ